MRLHEFFQKWARKRGVTMAEKLAVEIRKLLSVPYPPASKPGESPHRRTGKLQGSVTVIRTKRGASVQVYAPYAKFLEPKPYGEGRRNKRNERPFFARVMRKLGLRPKR